MKLTKFFVGFFALAAMTLTTSCLSSEDEGLEPLDDLASAYASTVAQDGSKTLYDGGSSATITAADVAALSDDAVVTLSVDVAADANSANVRLDSSDGSTAALSGSGVAVTVAGLAPNTTYTVSDGSTVTTDAQGRARVYVTNYNTPVTLTVVSSHSGGAGK